MLRVLHRRGGTDEATEPVVHVVLHQRTDVLQLRYAKNLVACARAIFKINRQETNMRYALPNVTTDLKWYNYVASGNSGE